MSSDLFQLCNVGKTIKCSNHHMEIKPKLKPKGSFFYTILSNCLILFYILVRVLSILK